LKFLKIAFLFFGFYLLFKTVQGVGVENITLNLAQLGWQLALVLPIYIFVFLLNTLGWVYSFPKPLPKSIPLTNLCIIRIIGETLNTLIPWAASLGGEPVKAEILKRKYGVSYSESTAAMLIVHTTFWISLNLLVFNRRVNRNPPPLAANRRALEKRFDVFNRLRRCRDVFDIGFMDRYFHKNAPMDEKI
jgi:uncharacterized membrane protein YbhN (UPF0104 family)